MDQTVIKFSAPKSRGKVPVSVVIPCYRCHKTVRSAVNSVLSQTAGAEEIILVEDCSGDDGKTLRTLESIRNELRGVTKVTVISMTQNMGAGDSRNAGWSVASQELVAFLDSDDTWHPRKLEIQASWLLEKPEFMLSCHDFVHWSQAGANSFVFDRIFERNISFHKLLFMNDIATSSVMLRRNIPYRFPNGMRYAEDFHLWLRVLLEYGACKRICLPLAFFWKDEFDVNGLSGNLVAMHRGVTKCIMGVRQDFPVSYSCSLLAVLFEKLKFYRRLLLRRLRKKL